MRERSKDDLRLNLSPPRGRAAAAMGEGDGVDRRRAESSTGSSGHTSPLSCLSSELNQEVSSPSSPPSVASASTMTNATVKNSPAAAATAAMVVAGCPRCLMYLMVLEGDSRCPKCGSNVLLDLLSKKNDDNNKTPK